ncbi:MAG: hypothetical protein MRZ37_00485 [Tenericutes bacterium]|nr:hypothetical protein [Mycoplasmatota bacterium]
MKKSLLFMFFLMLFFTLYQIVDTYALFESNKNYEVTKDIAKWIIKVNGNDVTKTDSFVVEQINYDDSEYVIKGKIAPSLKGYFDIVIDAKEAEVSSLYNIVFDFTNLSSSLKISSIEELNGNNLLLSNIDTYSGVILLSDDNKIHTIRVTLFWENNEDNNEQDSLIGTENKVINIPISVNILQYLGEELSIYTG